MLSKSYKQTLIISIVLAEIFTLSGLVLSFYLDLRPGGTIVLTGVIILIIIMILTSRRRI